MGKKIIGTSIAMPAVFDAGSSNPIDSRFVVETLEDLTNPETFGTEGNYCFIYEGIQIYVSSEKTIYIYIGPIDEGNGVLSAEVAKPENWTSNADEIALRNIKFGLIGTEEDINFKKDFAVRMNDGSIYIVKDIDWTEYGRTSWCYTKGKIISFDYDSPLKLDLWYTAKYPKFNKVISLGDTTVLDNRILLFGYFTNPDVYEDLLGSDGRQMKLILGWVSKDIKFSKYGFDLSELSTFLSGFIIPPKIKATFTRNECAFKLCTFTDPGNWGVDGDKEILYEIEFNNTFERIFEECALPDLRRIKVTRNAIVPDTEYWDYKDCTFLTPLTASTASDWANYSQTSQMNVCFGPRAVRHNPSLGEDYILDFTVFDYSNVETSWGLFDGITARGIKIALPNLKLSLWSYLVPGLKTIIITELGTLENGSSNFIIPLKGNTIESVTINMENVINGPSMFWHGNNGDTPGFPNCTYLHLEKLKTNIDISGFMNCSLDSIKFIFDSAQDVTASPKTLTIFTGLYNLIPTEWIDAFKAKGWNLKHRTTQYLEEYFNNGVYNKQEVELLVTNVTSDFNNVSSEIQSHISNKSNPHTVTKAQVGLGNVTNDAQVKRSEMGVVNGVATLDSSGKVPSSQLPSYVDDIVDVYATYTISDTGAISDVNLYLDAAHTQPVTGESGKIYLNVTDNEPAYQFRWTGTVFAQTGASSLIIGEVEGTAFDGKKGKDLSELLEPIRLYPYYLADMLQDLLLCNQESDLITLGYNFVNFGSKNYYGYNSLNINSATTEKAGVMSASDKTTLDELANLVIADKTTLNFAATPANIEKGVNTTVTLNWSIYFGGELVEISSLDVKKGSTTILTDVGRRQTTDTTSDTTSYSVTIGYRGITKTTSKTVNAYYPKYYGGSAKATITADDVTTFTKLAISGSASGTYNITSADDQYIWFCIPSSMNINKVTLGGFAVPLESPITLAVTGKGNYKCYRSSNPLSAGTRSFVIS